MSEGELQTGSGERQQSTSEKSNVVAGWLGWKYWRHPCLNPYSLPVRGHTWGDVNITHGYTVLLSTPSRHHLVICVSGALSLIRRSGSSSNGSRQGNNAVHVALVCANLEVA